MITDLLQLGLTAAVLWLLWTVLWLLYEIRTALGVRGRPALLPTRPKATSARADFQGAIPPERYVVMRWPLGVKHYGGCNGAAARREFEGQHPRAGEEVEFWELGDRRGHKVG